MKPSHSSRPTDLSRCICLKVGIVDIVPQHRHVRLFPVHLYDAVSIGLDFACDFTHILARGVPNPERNCH